MSMDRDVIMDILRDACRAPSADNTQPWRFDVRGDTIQVWNAGDQEESVFNYGQQVNHASLGACIENLIQSATAHGFSTSLLLFPESGEPLLVAKVVLSRGASQPSPLAYEIAKRSSNRKHYEPTPIPQETLDELSGLATSSEGRVSFVTGNSVARVAKIISAGEKLALENKPIHDFLFDHVTWTKEEDAVKHGFLIDTFEFAPPQRALFKLFRNWNILKLFIPLGFPDFVAKDMAKVYATSAAFGAILIEESGPEAYVRAGMLFERIWLTATKHGVALQPTTGLQFFAQPVLAGERFELSDSTARFIRERYAALVEAFGARTGETIAIAFRMGYADAPSAMTTRFEPDVRFED